MDAATNLSAHAKPWAPNGSRPQRHQHAGPTHSDPGSTDGGLNGGGVGAPLRGIGSRGGVHSSSGSSMGMMAQQQQEQHREYSNPAGMLQMLSQQQQMQQQPKLSPTAAKLFVGQLPFECTDERLRNLFNAYGTVEHIHILRDNNNRSRGAAFITYSTVQEADTAIFTLHNRYRMLTNRAIQVSYAKNSPNISPFGTQSALEVHQSNPTNPLPDVAAMASQVNRLF